VCTGGPSVRYGGRVVGSYAHDGTDFVPRLGLDRCSSIYALVTRRFGAREPTGCPCDTTARASVVTTTTGPTSFRGSGRDRCHRFYELVTRRFGARATRGPSVRYGGRRWFYGSVGVPFARSSDMRVYRQRRGIIPCVRRMLGRVSGQPLSRVGSCCSGLCRPCRTGPLGRAGLVSR